MIEGRLHDGDLFKLKDDENATKAEFVNTPGRGIAWRLYNRIGQGIVLTHEEAKEFHTILSESLDDHYTTRGFYVKE